MFQNFSGQWRRILVLDFDRLQASVDKTEAGIPSQVTDESAAEEVGEVLGRIDLSASMSSW